MYKPSKFHIETYLIEPLIYLLWEPFSGKRSHFWNWSKYGGNLDKWVTVKGEKKNHPINNLWNTLVELNFKWKKLVILKPVNYNGEYQIIYRNAKTEICSLVLKGKTGCLVGSSDTDFTAISYPDGKELKLEILGYTDKRKKERDVFFI
jgi:hypothetical protein